MVSRKGSIVALAEAKSQGIIDGLVEGSKVRVNAEAMRAICRNLLARRSPRKPSAAVVSEFGAHSDPDFPRIQTIYNTPSYSRMLSVWRTAFCDVVCIDANEPLTADMVSAIDTSGMESSNAAVVARLKEIVFELTQRCNALKRIIDQGVPVPAGDVPADASEIMQQLEIWIQSMEDGPFELDDVALKVSRRTPPGTRVMMSSLFNELRTFVADYRNVQAARQAAAGS